MVGPQSWFNQSRQLSLVSSLALIGALGGASNCVFAQIIPDNTLGSQNSTVTSVSSVDQFIAGGAPRGANLFHSFQEFNVDSGKTVLFDNPPGIDNILSRVTGENPSNILGTLGVLGNANLFLINPNGIIFGRNASLAVAGSFLGSTASSLNFADGTQFSATAHSTTPVLTMSVPIGLQFGRNAGSIRNQSQATNFRGELVGLEVLPGYTLALVGGHVALEGGRLTAAGGRIELGSVAGNGLVSLNPKDSGWALGYEFTQDFRDIQLSQQALVNASGEGGGDIHVQGRHVALTNGAHVGAGTFNQELGGTLTVRAKESVQLSGTSADGKVVSGLFTQTEGAGAAGALTIETGRLIVQDGAQVSASTRSSGQGGTLSVKTSESVELSGTSTSADNPTPSGLFAVTQGGSGRSGVLTIETGQLIVRDGAQVTASTVGTGQGGGKLTVTARESVQLIGTSAIGQLRSGLLVGAEGGGAAGDLTIETGKLLVQDGAVVSARTSGQVSGGNIILRVQDLLLLRRNGQISTSAGTTGAGGEGGNINIDTNFLVAVPSEDSDITADAFKGKGGFIQIRAQGIFGLERREQPTELSDITAVSQQNPDLNGVVEINTLDIDPSSGLVALPEEVVDAAGLIAQACPAGGGSAIGSEFIVTGRGGLPDNPSDSLSTNAIQVDWVTLNPGVENSSSPTVSTNPTASEPAPIVEAQGWIVGPSGEVVLTAQAPTVTPHIPWMTPATCHGASTFPKQPLTLGTR